MLTSVQNVCVVTTFYTLEGMKSILLPEFVFFRSRLRLSLKNTNSLFYCFIFILRGCCTSYYNIPSSLPEGAFVLCALKVRLLFLTSTAFVSTKAKPRARRGYNYCHSIKNRWNTRYLLFQIPNQMYQILRVSLRIHQIEHLQKECNLSP